MAQLMPRMQVSDEQYEGRTTATSKGLLDLLLKHQAVLIVVLALVLGMFYALSIPSLQGFDEEAHLAYVNWIARGQGLPNQYDRNDSPGYEGLQFPTYYIIAGSIIGLLSNGDGIRYTAVSAPTGRITYHRDLVRAWFHDPASRRLFYLLRSFGVICFVLSVAISLKVGQLLWPNSSYWSLLPALFIALLPQLAFDCATVNNDGLVICFSTAAVYWIVRLIKGGGRWDSLLFGLFVGLAVATKKDALFLFAATPLVLWVQSRRFSVPLSELAVRATLACTAIAAMCGWVFVRNYILYGSFLAEDMEQQSVYWIIHNKTFADPYFETVFPTALYRSFFVHFGRTIVPPAWVYDGYGLLMLVALAGLIALIRSRVELALVAVIGLTLLVTLLVGVACYNLHFSQPQGRFLFPAIAAIAVLLTLGIERLCAMLPEKTAQVVKFLVSSYIAIAAGVCSYTLLGCYYG